VKPKQLLEIANKSQTEATKPSCSRFTATQDQDHEEIDVCSMVNENETTELKSEEPLDLKTGRSHGFSIDELMKR